MAARTKICTIDPEVSKEVKAFRFRKEKNNAAIVLKVDVESMNIILDKNLMTELEDYDNLTVEELAEVLPAHQPRYVIYNYTYKMDDGRISYPLIFIFISPQGSKPELQMMYAGTKLALINELGMSKDLEVRSVEELTEEWLLSKLALYR